MFSRLVRPRLRRRRPGLPAWYLFFVNRFTQRLRVVALGLVGRIGNRLRRMFEAQIALTIGLIAGLILGWLTAGMQ